MSNTKSNFLGGFYIFIIYKNVLELVLNIGSCFGKLLFVVPIPRTLVLVLLFDLCSSLDSLYQNFMNINMRT